MGKLYIGIDNGITGKMAVYYPDNVIWVHDHIVSNEMIKSKNRNYKRIDHIYFKKYMETFLLAKKNTDIHVLIEDPYINNKSIYTTDSASRSDECLRIILEQLGIEYKHVSAHIWQNDLLYKDEYIRGKHKYRTIKELARFKVCEMISRKIIDSVISKTYKDLDSVLLSYYCKLYYEGKIKLEKK